MDAFDQEVYFELEPSYQTMEASKKALEKAIKLPQEVLVKETSKELATQTAKKTTEQTLANAKNLATDVAGG